MECLLKSGGISRISFQTTPTFVSTDFRVPDPNLISFSSHPSHSSLQIVDTASFSRPKKPVSSYANIGRSSQCSNLQIGDTNSFSRPKKPVRYGANMIRMMSAGPSTDERPAEETIPKQEVLSQHPLDPHKPNFSELLPSAVRPYPSFEGWFVRLWDPESNFSAAVIMATNYATDESQVTLLFTVEEKQGKSEANGKGMRRTHAVAEFAKDAKFTDIPSKNMNGDREPVNSEPVGFEWISPGLGRIKTTSEITEIGLTVKGYSIQALLTKHVLWDADQSERGPEGWASSLPIPTHWYVYSLGSRAEFEFSGPEGGLSRKAVGWGHQEKNWGLTFPSGHVWFQGFTSDNSAQLIGSAAYFKIGDSIKTPYLITLAYRSPEVGIDMRTNDLGTVFKDISISPSTGEFSVEGISASHTVKIKARADPQSFSEAILAPMGKVHWKPACRETYLAEVDVEVYEHAVWGVVGKSKLMDKRTFKYAGLEFGEDLLNEEAEKKESEDESEQIERSRAIDS